MYQKTASTYICTLHRVFVYNTCIFMCIYKEGEGERQRMRKSERERERGRTKQKRQH